MVDLNEPVRTRAKADRDGDRGRTRQGWRRRLSLLSIAAVLVSATGFTIWNRYVSQATPVNPGTTCPVVVQPTGHLPLASIGIKRVALIGDSVMYQASCSIAASLARVGVETDRYAVGGTGLLSGPLDWGKETSFIMATDRPNAVFGIFVGNYWPAASLGAYSRVVRDDSPQFYALWQERAVQLSNEVRSAGATMYWVSPPPIKTPPLAHAQRLYDGYRSIPGDQTIDAGTILAGADGQEVSDKTTCGKTVAVRTPDGVHLTDDGARIYGQEIAHLFTAQTGLLTSPKPC
jgi:hypothetical protein